MNLRDEVKRNWIEAFGDSAEYVEMFFDRIYREEEVLCIRNQDNRVISSLLLQPYEMTFHGSIVPMGYICGMATRRKDRGEGHASELLTMALNTAREKSMMAVALIPANDRLYFFYDKFNFSTVIYSDRRQFTKVHSFAGFEEGLHEVNPYDPGAYEAISKYERMRPCTVLHSHRNYLNLIDDLHADGGHMVIMADSEGQVRSFGTFVERDGMILVRGLNGPTGESRLAILHKIRQENPDKPIMVKAPLSDESRRPCSEGMMRIVNVRMAMDAIAKANPTLQLRIIVRDCLIPDNTGCYSIKDGQCMRIDASMCNNQQLDVDIDTFNRLVFSAHSIGDITGLPSERPWMTLMLE